MRPSPAPHTDFLPQDIEYRVPPELAQLIWFDGNILVDRSAARQPRGVIQWRPLCWARTWCRSL